MNKVICAQRLTLIFDENLFYKLLVINCKSYTELCIFQFTWTVLHPKCKRSVSFTFMMSGDFDKLVDLHMILFRWCGMFFSCGWKIFQTLVFPFSFHDSYLLFLNKWSMFAFYVCSTIMIIIKASGVLGIRRDAYECQFFSNPIIPNVFSSSSFFWNSILKCETSLA